MTPLSEFEEFLFARGFSERDLKEIAFARLYAQDFAHGTDGHNRLLIISRMADLLEGVYNTAKLENINKTVQLKD